jgi:hypothetical protein
VVDVRDSADGQDRARDDGEVSLRDDGLTPQEYLRPSEGHGNGRQTV